MCSKNNGLTLIYWKRVVTAGLSESSDPTSLWCAHRDRCVLGEITLMGP